MVETSNGDDAPSQAFVVLLREGPPPHLEDVLLPLAAAAAVAVICPISRCFFFLFGSRRASLVLRRPGQTTGKNLHGSDDVDDDDDVSDFA
jgi:hypothetical protein